jgi:predicted regulator of Ras-like GTPase activity (Roadblock/LC7/MglB family)
MIRTDELNNILIRLQASSTDFEASAVVSEDGLMIASLLPQGLEETQIAAMSAAMMTMGTKTAKELKRGNLKQLFVKGDDGYVVISQAGPHAVLLALAREDAKLGLIFLGLSRAAEETKKILSPG